jgi:hypothetical protein
MLLIRILLIRAKPVVLAACVRHGKHDLLFLERTLTSSSNSAPPCRGWYGFCSLLGSPSSLIPGHGVLPLEKTLPKYGKVVLALTPIFDTSMNVYYAKIRICSMNEGFPKTSVSGKSSTIKNLQEENYDQGNLRRYGRD